MKKYLSVMLAIVISFFVFIQAYCIEINGNPKSGAAYLYPKADSTTVIDNPSKFIYGLKQGINKNELLNQYIETADGVDIAVSDKIGTGVKLNICDSSSGNTIDTYTALIVGDVNGDGFYNGMDSITVKCLSASLLSENDLEEESLITADCNQNGQIDEADYEALESAGVFLEEIDQTYIHEDYLVKDVNMKVKFPNVEKYMYRVGNGNNVALSSLFEIDDITKPIDSTKVQLTIETLEGNASGKYTANTTDWSNGTLKFSGTGIVKINISQGGEPLVLLLEVVNGTNATTAVSATSNNVVLLNDVKASASLSVNSRTLYGNGFKVDLSSVSIARFGGGINLNSGTLNNVQVIGPVYKNTAIYSSDDNFSHTVKSTGTSYIYNSYISNARCPLRVDNGTLYADNSVFDSGRYANIEVGAGNLNLNNVTTINQPRQTETGMRVGIGIVLAETAVNSQITATGYLKQYNWLGKTRDVSYCVGDNTSGEHPDTSNNAVTSLFNKMFSISMDTSYNGDRFVNTGIACMNSGAPYATGSALIGYTSKSVSLGGSNGWVMSPKSSFDAVESHKYYTQTVYEPTEQIPYVPSFTWSYPSTYKDGAVNLSFEQGSSVEFNPNILTVSKYGQTFAVSVQMNGTDYTGKSISFNKSGDYTVTYTVTDPHNYDCNGAFVGSRTYTKTLNIKVSETIPDIKSPEFTFKNSSGNISGTRTIEINGLTYIMPDVSATSTNLIGAKAVSGKTIYCPIVEADFKNNTSDFNILYPIFSGVTIKNYTDISGSVTTYAASTNISSMPDELKWRNDSEGFNNGKGWDSYGRDSSLGLYRKTGAIGSDQGERTVYVGFAFAAGNGETYYYYIGYHIAAHTCPSSCFAEGTMLTLADGTQKPVEELTFNDKMAAWDFFNGDYTSKNAVLIVNHGKDYYTVVNSEFSDGTVLRTIGSHGIFDIDLNEFVYINSDNCKEFVGHNFVQYQNDGTYSVVTLIDTYITEEYTTAYSVTSENAFNVFANGMLTVAPPEKFYCWIKMGDTLRYGTEAFNDDVEQYGLYDYSAFSSFVTYEQYKAFNGQYLRIPVEKGIMSFDDIVELVDTYSEFMPAK